MFTQINPKLPMRNKAVTKNYYINLLGFTQYGSDAYPDYLMLEKDTIQIHFFLFTSLIPSDNYGQVYIRTNDINTLYQSLLTTNVPIHPNGALKKQSWGQLEFSLLDPDNNLLTFGQSII